MCTLYSWNRKSVDSRPPTFGFKGPKYTWSDWLWNIWVAERFSILGILVGNTKDAAIFPTGRWPRVLICFTFRTHTGDSDEYSIGKDNMGSRPLLLPDEEDSPISRSPFSPTMDTEEDEDKRVDDPANRPLSSNSHFEDPGDDIYEEVETVNAPALQDWRSRRPRVLKSLAESAWVVVGATFLGGIVLGLFAVACVYIKINTANYCHWIDNKNLPRNLLKLRVIGDVLGVFITEYWQFLIFWFVFGWPLMKELNLTTVAFVAAFVDVSYHILLFVFHSYKSPLIPYPNNVLFVCATLYCSYAIGRNKFPESKLNAMKLSVKLCAQFLFGIPISFLFNYVIFKLFARTPSGLQRLAIAATAPMILLPAKLISRQCAINLPNDVCHPGNAHAIISVIYGCSALVFRTFQAGIESFPLFVCLSVGSGIVYIVERLTVPLRDKWLAKLGRSCCRCCGRSSNTPGPEVQSGLNNPRYRRLTADMTIQGILFESVAIVFSTSVLYMYAMVYDISAKNWGRFGFEGARKVLVALLVETVFNSIAVHFQVRYFNVPIVKVWRRKWKKHVTLASITATLTTVYFTGYMLQFIRAVYINDQHFNITANCTEPFHFAGPHQGLVPTTLRRWKRNLAISGRFNLLWNFINDLCLEQSLPILFHAHCRIFTMLRMLHAN